MGFLNRMKDSMGQAKAMGGLGDISTQATMADAAAINASGADMRRLWAEGLDASGVIKDARDTGQPLAGNLVLDLDMVVTIEGGEPYDVTHRMTIAGTDTAPYAPGSEYNLKVDPEDRQKVTFAPPA